ncbi:hypothetical protein [Egbenema bharatensis]|uniref:hypothetical protein n=1 Tax=Egbenema bharatensis TaxID=3463334 RepID=UPI003A84E899
MPAQSSNPTPCGVGILPAQSSNPTACGVGILPAQSSNPTLAKPIENPQQKVAAYACVC